MRYQLRYCPTLSCQERPDPIGFASCQQAGKGRKIVRLNTNPSPESLLHIPLVKEALSDPRFVLQSRAIDADWAYSQAIPISVSGFNPFYQTYYFATRSVMAQWLKNPAASARELNEQDVLVREALFLAHDYLHTWAYQAIHQLVPALRFGTVPITPKNFEDFVFCHLLSETVATVGLDYWYLAATNLNQVCDIGTAVRTLTTAYREEHLSKYRRFHPKLEVQTPKFFETFARFYCDGVFPGYELDDLRKSPLTLKWIKNELEYGETQRSYARAWGAYLSGESFDSLGCPEGKLDRPVDPSSSWKKELITNLGQLLWKKVKEGRDEIAPVRFDPGAVFEKAGAKDLDFRFRNVNRVEPDAAVKKILAGPRPKRNFDHFFYQYVSGFEYGNPKTVELLLQLRKKRDFKAIELLLRKEKRVILAQDLPKEFKGTEPEHLFILN